VQQLKVSLSYKQTQAYDLLDSEDISFLLYGGAKGGGKSVFGCFWVCSKALEIIKRFNLIPSKYPIPIAFLGRKRGVDFSDTTLETWKRFIPSDLYSLRPGDKEIIILDTLKIHYGGFDDENDVKKFNSAEYAYFFIDQAEEISQDDYALLRGTLRLKINNQPLNYKGLLTANPADCWLKDEFILNPLKNYKFIQALPNDNPYLPEDYINNLREAFKHRPELIRAYVEGDWETLSDNDLVIKPQWISKNINRPLNFLPYQTKLRTIVSCDPARYGDDETVIYVIQNGMVIDQLIYGQKSTMETAGNCVMLKNKHNADMIICDETGLGGGVVDRLKELNQNVLGVNFGSRPSSDEKALKYLNLRAEIYWEVASEFADDRVSIPNDITLRQQLGHIKYKTASQGRIQIESKDDIKKRMSGKSPDRADALVLGIWGLQFIKEEQVDFYRKELHLEPNPLYTELVESLVGNPNKSDYEA
jgi:hypothetical protein